MRKSKLAVMLGVISVASSLSGCYGVIDQGNAGVRTGWSGEVSQETVHGPYQHFLSSVDIFTTKETSVDLTNMRPRAADNLTLKELDVEIYYRADEAKLPFFRSNFAGQSAQLEGEQFIRPGYVMVKSLGKSVSMEEVAKRDSLTLHSKRSDLEEAIKLGLQQQIDRAAPATFTITRVVVTNIQTDPTIEDSIRDNVTASKRLDTAKKQVEIRAQEAMANEKLSQSLTPEYLQHEYIAAIKSCADNSKCTLVVDGSASSKMINLNNK